VKNAAYPYSKISSIIIILNIRITQIKLTVKMVKLLHAEV